MLKTNTMCLLYIWGLQKNDTVYSVGFGLCVGFGYVYIFYRPIYIYYIY